MRTTDNKKDSVIRVRIPEDLKDKIYKESRIKGITISEYIRRLIEKDIYSF